MNETVQTGQLLKFFREYRNFTPEDLAEVIAVDYRTYIKIENGQREIRFNELLLLCEKLKISPAVFYNGFNFSNNFTDITSTSSCVGYNNSNHVTIANDEILKALHELLITQFDFLKGASEFLKEIRHQKK